MGNSRDWKLKINDLEYHDSCSVNLHALNILVGGRFVTLKKIRSKIWTWKKQGTKNRVIVIQKKKRPGCLFSFWIQVILFEVDCAIFYANLHELFGQFISWTYWVNLWIIAEYHVKLWLIWKKVYDDLIIITL